jgi:SAM-dependent methyltransferase
MTESPLQLFPALDPATEAALRASIERWGVLVPVAKDQHGRIIDGHHRSRIADELGVDYQVIVHDVDDDDHAEALARTLNTDRRHLDADQRRELVAHLRAEGHSYRAIADAVGTSLGAVQRDLATVSTDTVPDRIVGRDGKSRPASRSAAKPGDTVTDDYGDTRLVADIEDYGDTVVIHDGEGDALIVPKDDDRPAITKPDLGDGISHPARYSDALLPIFQAAVPVDRYPKVLDPFAGTGRIHQLANETIGIEIEPEWAALHPKTYIGNAVALGFDDDEFDAIVTSPTYGNRLADSHNASDPELRRSYTHDLGRQLAEDNSGQMQWGPEYRHLHRRAWDEAKRVLRPGGRLVLNIKDHIRSGERQQVAGWHVTHLIGMGFRLAYCTDVATRSLRQGENGELRLTEQVFVFDLEGQP